MAFHTDTALSFHFWPQKRLFSKRKFSSSSSSSLTSASTTTTATIDLNQKKTDLLLRNSLEGNQTKSISTRDNNLEKQKSSSRLR